MIMNKSDWGLLIVVLTYIGITFADIMKWINELLAAYGKLIFFVLIIIIIYNHDKN